MTSPSLKEDTILSSHRKKRTAEAAPKTCSWPQWNSAMQQCKTKVTLKELWFSYKTWTRRTRMFQVRITIVFNRTTIIKARFCHKQMIKVRFLDHSLIIISDIMGLRSKRITIIVTTCQELTLMKTSWNTMLISNVIPVFLVSANGIWALKTWKDKTWIQKLTWSFYNNFKFFSKKSKMTFKWE